MEFKKFSTEFSSFEVTEASKSGNDDNPYLVGMNSGEIESRNSQFEIGFNTGPQDHRGTASQSPNNQGVKRPESANVGLPENIT